MRKSSKALFLEPQATMRNWTRLLRAIAMTSSRKACIPRRSWIFVSLKSPPPSR